MIPGNDRAPDAGNTRGNSGRAGTSTITRNPDVPRLSSLGCPAGCPLDARGVTVHECGVGEPIAELAPPDQYQRAGRDKDWPEREYIGRKTLDRQRGVA